MHSNSKKDSDKLKELIEKWANLSATSISNELTLLLKIGFENDRRDIPPSSNK